MLNFAHWGKGHFAHFKPHHENLGAFEKKINLQNHYLTTSCAQRKQPPKAMNRVEKKTEKKLSNLNQMNHTAINIKVTFGQ